jgi:hypothetical protein
MNTKVSCLIGTLMLCFYLGMAQTSGSKPVTASPEAYALMKMVNYPVNLNTGIPDISIPFYQAESGDLKLSVGISYHAGGFKTDERSTSVGLGWSMSNDLQIVRSVNGLDDFKSQGGYLANTKMKTYYRDYGSCISCDYPFFESVPYPEYNIGQLAFGVVDGMPDKFSYRLLNKSGSFYFVKSNDGTGYSILPVPYENIKIKYDDGRFIITDTDGTVYYFGAPGSSDISNTANYAFEATWSNSEAIKTAWKCVEIQNASRTEKISFTYKPKTVITSAKAVENIEYYNNPDPSTIGPGLILNNQPVYPGTTEYEHLLTQYPFYALSSPKYMVNYVDRSVFYLPYLDNNNQVVNRTFTNPGSHVTGYSSVNGIAPYQITFRGGTITFDGTDKLNSIVIRDPSGNEIKTVEFNSDYTAAQNMTYAKQYNGPDFQGTLYLNRIRMKNQLEEFETYGFVYQKACFGDHIKGSNAWGYANIGTNESWTNGPVGVPPQKITQKFQKSTYSPGTDYVDNVIFNIGGGNEMADESGLFRGLLKRIIYPTGGYADFDLEPNLYKETVHDYSGSYPLVQMGGGLRIRSITLRDGKTSKLQSQKYYRYGELEEGLGLVWNSPPRTFLPDKYAYDGYSYSQNMIYYRNSNSTTCYNKGCLSAFLKETKTTYLPASSLNYAYPNGSPIYYTRVTEYESDLGVQTGKKVHTFYPPSQFDVNGNITTIVSGTNVPLLVAEGLRGAQASIIDYRFENGSYKFIHSKHFNYIKYERPEQSRVAYAFTKNIYVPVGGNIGPNIDFYNPTTSWGAGGVSIGSNFVYGGYGLPSAKLLLIAEKEKWVNNTDTLFTSTQYTYDKLPYLQPTKITTTNSRGQQISTSYKYAYDFPGVSIYDQMKSDNVNMISQPVEQVVTNESQSKQLSRTLTNYAVINQGTGFIAPVTIQKSVNAGPLETEMAFKYNGNANLIEMTGKDGVPKSYLWGYNYKYPIAEFTGIDYSTATSSINVADLQNITDEEQLKTTLSGLRVANPAAIVTTYTYKPLRGVSSITSANGSTKSYVYDTYGRLQIVKNHNGYVLEKHGYKMGEQNPASFADPGFMNIPMMATFSQSCSSGLVRPYNYIVPGGKYYSSSASLANYNAEDFLYQQGPSNLGYGTECFNLSQLATIKLRSVMNTGIPYTNNTYLDFIQDDAVKGTYKFPYFSTAYPENQFIMNPGAYKVSFRQDAIYGGAVIKYYVSTSAGDSFYIKHGETITLLPGVVYSIGVTNSF